MWAEYLIYKYSHGHELPIIVPNIIPNMASLNSSPICYMVFTLYNAENMKISMLLSP